MVRSPMLLELAVLALLLVAAVGDVYLNNPRGSNNKLNEPSNNVRNDNRLFDSQNNGAGGYQVGDNCKPVCSGANGQYNPDAEGAGEGIMNYYEGSELYVEWSHQHSSGPDGENPNVHSDVVLQYMCESEMPGLRDGKSTSTIDNSPEGEADLSRGMHEDLKYYQDCKARERNRGLFTADRNVNNNRGATATRQNNNGQRFGYECPEERDYYPYWHPTPWTDLAILTSDTSRCSLYREQSENVRGRHYCSDPQHNNQPKCEDFPSSAQWLEAPPKSRPPPACEEVAHMRDNHHGNTVGGVPLSYNWTLPRGVVPSGSDALRCVMRIRYNISSGDYVAWGDGMADSRANGERSPVKQNPTKDFLGGGYNETGPLRLAINTNQVGRVFEDRTHVFRVLRRPRELESAKIWNLNVRGRRGNIVQVYPSVEYDFAPATLVATEGDYVHVQWTGSDANPNGNDGEGRRMTDRSNLVQFRDGGADSNFPVAAEQHTLFVGEGGQPDMEAVSSLAFLNQTGCDFETSDTNSIQNCALLNAAPAYFDGGVRQLRHVGHHHIASTRNNNFSNRSQKASVIVNGRNALARIVLMSVGGAVGLAAVSTVAAVAAANAAAANPTGALARGLRKVPGVRLLAPSQSVAGPDLESAGGAGSISRASMEVAQPPPDHGLLLRWWFGKSQNFRAGCAFAVLNAAFFALGFFLHSHELRFDSGFFFAVAKGGGYLLDFSLALVLFPMMKNLVSWMRTTPLGDVLPLDDHHRAHILVAKIIVIGTALHVAGHYGTFVWRRDTIWRSAIANREGATGHMILALMCLMYVTSVARHGVKIGRFARFGSYDSFWLTHQLYLLVFVLLFLHSEAFYKWAFWPVVLFALDKLIHVLRGRKQVVLSHVSQEAKGTDVMSVHMRVHSDEGQRFFFKPGQYLYLNCPELSKHEWHPFTITSAPEEDLVSVHIRCRGDWTRGLRALLNPGQDRLVVFEQDPTQAGGDDGGVGADLAGEDREEGGAGKGKIGMGSVGSSSPSRNSVSPTAPPIDVEIGRLAGGPASYPVMENVEELPDRLRVKPAPVVRRSQSLVSQAVTVLPPLHARLLATGEAKVCRAPVVLKVDGPYGSGSDRTGEYDTVILVGTGIGVTPFVSVMKSLKLRAARMGSRFLRPARVYFYWVCRDRKEFTWFSWLINDLEGLDGDRFEINTYMTGELNLSEMVEEHARMKKGDKGAGDTESNALWAGNKWAGRPNWRRVFEEKSRVHAGESVGVFLCGPGAAELDEMCRQSSKKGGTSFVFHKEVF